MYTFYISLTFVHQPIYNEDGTNEHNIQNIQSYNTLFECAHFIFYSLHAVTMNTHKEENPYRKYYCEFEIAY